MQDPTPIGAAHTIARMRAIAAELTAAGLHTRLHQTPAASTSAPPPGPKVTTGAWKPSSTRTTTSNCTTGTPPTPPRPRLPP